MDHYNDPVLVWCDFHGGSDMVPWSRMRQPCLEWMRTDRTSEFTHFNFVIRLSIVKQLAFPFSTILRDPAAPVIPLNVPDFFQRCSREADEKVKAGLLWQRVRMIAWDRIIWHFKATGMSSSCRYGLFGFGWSQKYCAPTVIPLNLNSIEQLFTAHVAWSTSDPFEGTTHELLGLNWIPFYFVLFHFSSPTSSPVGPLFHAFFSPQVGWVLCVPR